MKTVFKKEFRSYFMNMSGYVFISFILFMCGIFFAIYNIYIMHPDFSNTLYMVSYIFLLAVPVLTMRTVSGEKAQNTDKLLFSLPFSVTQIVVGKYLALLAVLLIPTAIMGLYPLILSIFGSVNFVASYATLIGFFLFGASLLAIGLFISSVTENTIVSAVVSFCVLLALFFMNSLGMTVPSGVTANVFAFTLIAILLSFVVYSYTKDKVIAISFCAVCEFIILIIAIFNRNLFYGSLAFVLSYLSIPSQFSKLLYGVFDLSIVVYYLSISALFVFLSIKSIEKKIG